MREVESKSPLVAGTWLMTWSPPAQNLPRGARCPKGYFSPSGGAHQSKTAEHGEEREACSGSQPTSSVPGPRVAGSGPGVAFRFGGVDQPLKPAEGREDQQRERGAEDRGGHSPQADGDADGGGQPDGAGGGQASNLALLA